MLCVLDLPHLFDLIVFSLVTLTPDNRPDCPVHLFSFFLRIPMSNFSVVTRSSYRFRSPELPLTYAYYHLILLALTLTLCVSVAEILET